MPIIIIGCNMRNFLLAIIFTSSLPFLTIINESSATPLQELPDEYDDFRAIRTSNKLYVDKSHYISQLLESEDWFFSMCRPGRFGKSTFLQMLNSFFRGEKNLFEGLQIVDKYDWRELFPVIFLDFSLLDVETLENFKTSLNRAIVLTGKSYGIEIDETLPLYTDQFSQSNRSKLGTLIDHLSDYGRHERSIVVLIDEWDWPIRQYSPGNEFNELKHIRRLEFRTFLGPFFQQLELARQSIKFLFVTCTTKICYKNSIVGAHEKKSIAFTDLTFDPRYSGMMGLSGEEMTNKLKPHLNEMVVAQPNETFQALVRKLRKHYNGYSFIGREHTTEGRLYNFHSILSYLRDKRLDHFWHPANDSKYNDIFDDYRDEIIYLSDRNIFNMSGLTVSRERLQKDYTVADVPLVVGLIFCGYLTFRGYDEKTGEFIVDFPNDEMRESFYRGVCKYLLGKEMSNLQFAQECEGLEESMADGKVDNFVERLNSLAFEPADKTILLEDHLYSYERLASIFQGCDFFLRENAVLSNDEKVVERFKVVVKAQPTNWEETRLHQYGLKIDLSNRSEYRIHFEFGRTASCALNVLLKAMSAEQDEARLLAPTASSLVSHLMGINFRQSGDRIDDWIDVRYSEGKCTQVQASHSHYLQMYEYVKNREAYSRLV